MTTGDLRAKAETFQALHRGEQPLVLLNAWDPGSAKLIAAAGMPAVATTSSGVGFALGYPDSEAIGRDLMLDVVGRVAAAVAVPVSADMLAGFGATPDAVGETVRLTIAAGAVGANIEDGLESRETPLRPAADAAERIRAARAAADAAGIPFAINARTDVYLRGGKGEAAFDEAVARANAYLAAGATSAFLPGVVDPTVIGRLVQAIDGPVNVMVGPAAPSVPELAALGVKRISLGGALQMATFGLVQRAAQEVQSTGTYAFAAGLAAYADLNRIMRG